MTDSFLKVYNRSILSKILIWVFFLGLIYFPIFLHLGSLPVVLWDESLFALRALFMYDHGEYMINFNQFENLPNHMNTKLPFTTFFQVLGFHLFGVNELAVRLPMALIFLGLSFWLYSFCKREFGVPWIAGVFVLLLVIDYGFMGDHMLRTGNQDAPFAMYLLFAALYFWKYIETRKTRDILWFCFFMTAALLTKNLLALSVCPGLFAFVLISRSRFKAVMGNYRTYLGALVIAGVYILTIAYFEWQYPGFFDRMWNYELMGRYSETIEGHSGGFFYYFDLYFNQSHSYLGYTVFLGLFVLLDKTAEPKLKRLVTLLSVVFISYLLVVSLSATKTQWYIAPLYPLGALIASLGIYQLHQFYISRSALPIQIFIGALMVLIFSDNYTYVLNKIYKAEPNHRQQSYGDYIERNRETLGEEFYIVDANFGTAAFFTKEVHNRSEGHNITFQKDYENMSLPARILTCSPTQMEYIQNNFKYELLADETNFCKSYIVHEKK